MKKEEFKKDIQLLKDKTPQIYNDVIKITNPLYHLYNEISAINIKFLQEKYELSLNEFDIITSLFYSGGDEHTLSPSILSERILFSSGGMTKILKKLQSKELVSRIENLEDRRNKLVKLTKKGAKIAQDALKDILLLESKYFSVLSESEKKEFSRILLKALRLEGQS